MVIGVLLLKYWLVIGELFVIKMRHWWLLRYCLLLK